MSNVKLTVIKSNAGNRVVKPDADGYYKVVLGAFNALNSAGEAYSFDNIENILNDKSNVLNTRMTTGRLRAEADHPRREPNQTTRDFVSRNLDISTARASAHIKQVWLEQTDISEGIPGLGKVVLVKGLVKPSGVYGKGLKDSLDNPEEDTCFSIRCFTVLKRVGIQAVRYVKQIVTWDWVNAPGIQYASVLNGPTVESADLCEFNIEELLAIEEAGLVTAESMDRVAVLKEITPEVSAEDVLSKW